MNLEASPATTMGPLEERGLDEGDARAVFERYGPNELPPPKRDHLGTRALRQVREPMALLLLGAAGVAGFGLGEQIDALAILAIVVANAIIALIQEGKATRALEALRTMEAPEATVIRSGRTLRMPARAIVPGDVVVLAAGDRVPADLRLLRCAGTEIDESLLTGESLPVLKEPGAARAGAGLADQRSLAFSGTLVVRGTARGVVIATGERTQLGVIAEHLRAPEPSTPLQAELRRMTARLGGVSVLIALGVFALTLARTGIHEDGLQIAFLSAAALAVAAVPEGLPTVVTVALALGVRRMALHGAIVRRLPAVETLGSTTVILTDKTGTLTENRMRLDVAVLANEEPRSPLSLPMPAAQRFELIAILCNDATIEPSTGDPMEIALLEAFGPERVARVRASASRVSDLPFDAIRRRMTTIERTANGSFMLTKGAPEEVLPLCATRLTAKGEEEAMRASDAQAILEQAGVIAARGARVLAFASKRANGEDPLSQERDLTFVALCALRDPIRAEAAAAVGEARAAGIHILMVTGDHAGTALAIAEEVGLADDGAHVLTGNELRASGFPTDPLVAPVYARVDPDEKLALTGALQALHHVVAVTGDGVNDAPALRRADIGVAMGRSGSDVAREAADMVVTDDNLATIVTAVREGRGIYDNVRKVVDYLVAGNLSEIMVVVGSLLLFPSLGVPLLPLQLLWINLLTDGFPALALAVDPVDPGLMDRPPRPRSHRLLGGASLTLAMTRATAIASCVLGALAFERYVWNEPWAHARATAFTVLVLAHLLYAFEARRPRDGRGGGMPDRWLVLAVLVGAGLQLAVVAIPALHDVFGVASLLAREWGLIAIAGVAPLALMWALNAVRVAATSRADAGSS